MSLGTAQPYIATYAILKRDNKILCVLRGKTGWMNDKYGLTSGKVEHNETFLQAALREAKEEAGVTIKESDLHHVLTMHRYEAGDDYPDWVDVFFEATSWEGEPYNAEPERHNKIEWLDPHNLPDNMIPAIRFAIEQIELGNNYCEFGWEK